MTKRAVGMMPSSIDPPGNRTGFILEFVYRKPICSFHLRKNRIGLPGQSRLEFLCNRYVQLRSATTQMPVLIGFLFSLLRLRQSYNKTLKNSPAINLVTSEAPESGAKGTRTPDASRLPNVLQLREASGLRRVHRRFWDRGRPGRKPSRNMAARRAAAHRAALQGRRRR
jgi:hypothetical protein